MIIVHRVHFSVYFEMNLSNRQNNNNNNESGNSSSSWINIRFVSSFAFSIYHILYSPWAKRFGKMNNNNNKKSREKQQLSPKNTQLDGRWWWLCGTPGGNIPFNETSINCRLMLIPFRWICMSVENVDLLLKNGHNLSAATHIHTLTFSIQITWLLL